MMRDASLSEQGLYDHREHLSHELDRLRWTWQLAPILTPRTQSRQNTLNEETSVDATEWIVKPVHPESLVNVARQLVSGL